MLIQSPNLLSVNTIAPSDRVGNRKRRSTTRSRIPFRHPTHFQSNSRPDRLERALNDAAVDAKRGTGRCRGERARDVGNKGSYLLRSGEALDERGGANFLEELGLKILKALVIALGQGIDEINDAARFGRAGQHAINGDSGTRDRLGKAAREGNLRSLVMP
jgi:hypothetical protein